MGKLVIYLADGTTMDVPLRKERITIGRRPDNDVCLPFPAVSGEHAQVVTILADSFLEDLGSTNGTIVNGKPVVKHFLVNHDQIDIGRQRLTYLADENAKVSALPPDIVSRQLRGLSERVEGVKAAPRAIVSSVLQAPARHTSDVAVADIERDMADAVAPATPLPPVAEQAAAPVVEPPINPAPAALRQTERGRAATPGAGAGVPLPATEATSVTSMPPRAPAVASAPAPERVAARAPAAAALPVSPLAPAVAPASSPVPVAPATVSASTPAPATPATAPASTPAPVVPRGPSVRVLSGASAGRTVAFPGPELSVGRVGVQVALVRKVEGGYLLIPIEGREPPRINGAAVAPAGSALHPGDTFEVAGVRLELSVQS